MSLYGQTTNRQWRVFTIDFRAVFERECRDSDYILWMPWDLVGLHSVCVCVCVCACVSMHAFVCVCVHCLMLYIYTPMNLECRSVQSCAFSFYCQLVSLVDGGQGYISLSLCIPKNSSLTVSSVLKSMAECIETPF